MERWFGKVYKRLSVRKDYYGSETWRQLTRQFPALLDLEKLEIGTKENLWVRPDEFTRETQPLWQQVGDGQIGVNDALTQLEQIGNRVLGQ